MDETEITATPATTPKVPHVEHVVLAALAEQSATVPTTGPALEGVDAWAAVFANGVAADDAKTIATNCLPDGYDQGAKATMAAMAQSPEPAPQPESLFHRIEDDVMWAAEQAAYSVSNLVARERGRTPDDGIDAWRKRTGGLWRHQHAA